MLVAYLCRHAHQPLSEILRLSVGDAWDLARAVSRWVSKDDPLVGG